MPGFYNHNYHILQTPGYVVILVEMIHDARIIPLDGRPHVSQHGVTSLRRMQKGTSTPALTVVRDPQALGRVSA